MKRWGDAFYDDALSGADILDQVQIAVVVTDRFSNLRYWNAYASRLFGLDDGHDYLGAPLVDVGIHEADHEQLAQLARRVLKGDSWEGTFAVLRGDSTWMHLRASAVPLKSSSGAVEGVVILANEALRSGRVEEQYGLLDRIGRKLAGSLEFEATVKAVAEILVPQFADHCFIDLQDHGRLVRRVSVHAEGWTPPPGSWPDVGEEV
ncbi:MAG TPA: PAS domain-containing protein, partial [Thermobifida alba]|nr:PAS domain-containing protein [Thermobifida alba]